MSCKHFRRCIQISAISRSSLGGDLFLRLGLDRLLRLHIRDQFYKQYTAMASCEKKENSAQNNSEEQEVTIEKVVAKDNKGIDYDKLISELPFTVSKGIRYWFCRKVFSKTCISYTHLVEPL